jgi:phosphatidylglycerophosphate synthase
MRIWIDATDSRSLLEVFGMTLIERQLRTITAAGIEPTEVVIELPPDSPSAVLPADLTARFKLRWLRESGPLHKRLGRALHEAQGEPLLALEADSIIDARLLQYLAEQTGSLAVCGGEGVERAAVLRLEGNALMGGTIDGRLPRLADLSVAQKTLTSLPLEAAPSYIKKLRRDLPIYLFRVTDPASRDRAERFLFWSNYKGSTDFFTKYVYPPLVWRAVRPLARWRIHPNIVTLFNVFITFLAVPLFAWEWWWAGFLCAYTMSVLDSVDGKLARLTFTSSWFGNILDHGLDIVHPPLWYFGWAWGLSGGDTDSFVFQAAIWMAVIYALDRIVAGVFNRRLGRSIHGYTPLDERMRTFISRRNINLPLFLVGWVAGIPVPTFLFIVLWQVACFVFHVERLVQFWNDKKAVEAAQ